MKFGTGWKPDKIDERDVKYAPEPMLGFAKEVDLRLTKCMPPIYNQLQLNSCTANATAAAIAYRRNMEGMPTLEPSRLFIYYGARLLEGTEGQDSGAQIRDAIKFVAANGAPDESFWGYTEHFFYASPPLGAYEAASKDMVVAYRRVDNTTLGDVISALNEGSPVIFGTLLYPQFENVGEDGLVQMPQGEIIGAHAMLIVGYNYDTSMFLVRNSWGEGWGMQGYCWMPFEYITNGTITSDCWVITLIQNIGAN